MADVGPCAKLAGFQKATKVGVRDSLVIGCIAKKYILHQRQQMAECDKIGKAKGSRGIISAYVVAITSLRGNIFEAEVSALRSIFCRVAVAVA